MIALFWVSVALVLYAYAGYPLTVALAARVMDRRVRRRRFFPSMTVVVAAYDEEKEIEGRLRNLLASEYPADRLEIVVASDGSSDQTVTRARGIGSPRVRVLDLPRQGKAQALADAVAHATGDIIVFTDANSEFRPDALAMLATNFADPDVGGVAGCTGYDVESAAESTGRGEDLYWRYDSWIKSLETRTGSVVSAHGGMYAIRRRLFRPVEDAAVTDDFAISTAVVEQGWRLVFEPRAVGFEQTMDEAGSEFRRRVRLMTRGLRGVVLRRALLNPFRYGFYSLALASRKLLRRLAPLTFAPIFIATCVLATESPAFGLLVVSQLALLGLAGVGWTLRRRRPGMSPILYVPFFFVLANVAALLAVSNVLRGVRIERWTPQRHDETSPRGGRAAPASPVT